MPSIHDITTRATAVVIITLAAITASCSSADPAAQKPSQPSASVPGPSVPPPIPDSSRPVNGTDDGPQPPPPPPASQAKILASEFAKAWARPALPADQWYAAIAPLCEQTFADQLRTVDPANIPASRITGKPTASPQATTTFTISTDGGTLIVIVGAVDGTWRVVGNDFQRATS